MSMLHAGRGQQSCVARPAPTRRHSIRSWQEAEAVLNTVASGLWGAGFAKKDVFAVRLALEEAIANAIKHGHRGDLTKPVRVRWRVSSSRVLLRVQDQGPGFDPGQVPDPLTPENLERASGRGLLLMRSYVTWVRHNRRGNAVTLCKRRAHP